MTGGELLPATAWEQAAIIGIFIVFVGILLAWFSKQSDKWQKFMFDIDEKWRTFNKEQREENNCAMADVNASLSNLTKTTGDLARSVEEMRSDIQAHDQQAKEILALVQKPAPRSRAKKNDAPVT
jgi:uncharacterized membrane-anchored protein YhcB (DUF1043 family)